MDKNKEEIMVVVKTTSPIEGTWIIKDDKNVFNFLSRIGFKEEEIKNIFNIYNIPFTSNLEIVFYALNKKQKYIFFERLKTMFWDIGISAIIKEEEKDG